MKGCSRAHAGVPRALRTQAHLRERLLLDASRIEVQAALDKADALKSPEAKLRTLRAALEAIRNDSIADELQAQQIQWLEEAIAEVDGAKFAIRLA